MPEFAKQNKSSELLENLIREENDRRSSQFTKSTFDPSYITECSRRIMYRSIGDNHSPKIRYMDVLSQESTKRKWVNIFDKCLKVSLVDKEVIAADSKYNITSEVDAIISLEDELYVTQIKPVNNEDFIKIQKKGALKKDVVELILCLWLLEMVNGLIVYENKNNGYYKIFYVEPYTPILNAVRSKCGDMMKHKINGTLPGRPYKDDSSVECKVCEFKTRCWEESRSHGK